MSPTDWAEFQRSLAATATSLAELAFDRQQRAAKNPETFERSSRTEVICTSSDGLTYRDMKIAVVMPDVEFASMAGHNGFGPRYQDLIAHCREVAETTLIVLTEQSDRVSQMGSTGADEMIAYCPRGNSRHERLEWSLRAVTGTLRDQPWEVDLQQRLSRIGPDMVIGVCHTAPERLRQVTLRWKSALFVEEDFAQLATEHRISRNGSALVAVERLARRRSLAPPTSCVVISPREVAWAQRSFPRSHVATLPLLADERYWTRLPSESSRCDVVVIGRFDDARNGAGLADTINALISRSIIRMPTITLVSPGPLHFALEPHVAAGTVTWMCDEPDARPWYRGAKIALVPAFVVSGAKSTILQAWATDCAVVASTPAAATVGARNGLDVLTGDDPQSLALAIETALTHDEVRRDLVNAGRRAVEGHYRPSVHAAFQTIIDTTLAGPVRSAGVIRDVLGKCLGSVSRATTLRAARRS